MRPGDAASTTGTGGPAPTASPTTVLGAPGAVLVIVSGPSGVGKDSVIDTLREEPGDSDFHYVVTCTTRPRRSYEVNGVHYRFLSLEAFTTLREAGELLEANEVHGNWYGTPRADVRDALVSGHDVILKIDVQGAAVVKQRVEDALLIFLVPPSLEDLFQRLQARATESADELDIRQRNAALELARQDDYDYVVVNETGQIGRTAALIREIVAAEKVAHPTRRTRI
jgi:guanylate kinase